MTDSTTPAPSVNIDTVAFDRKLYLISSLTDLLRDNVKELLELKIDKNSERAPMLPPVTSSAVGEEQRLGAHLVHRYNTLRDTALNHLQGDDVDALETWTSQLPAGSSKVEVFEAAATLARCIDVVMEQEAFIANQIQRREAIDQVFTDAGLKTSKLADKDNALSSGHYL